MQTRHWLRTDIWRVCSASRQVTAIKSSASLVLSFSLPLCLSFSLFLSLFLSLSLPFSLFLSFSLSLFLPFSLFLSFSLSLFLSFSLSVSLSLFFFSLFFSLFHILVADIEALETIDASEIYSQRLNAKEVIFPKENGKYIFPVADGRIKLSRGDQELRTPTLIWEHPNRGEGHVDFLGESEGSLPPPHDSFPDAGEAINDFRSMSGSFIFRHHVEPRVKLHSAREESFPIPLKYIDVSRTTHANMDVKQERRIDDYWNVDGSRDLS